jgi:type I restriction enzyme M protein
MSSAQNNEGAIRKAMIEADVVDCMVALPSQLFFNTQIPACIWFLTRDKRGHGRDRRGETLFIDARKRGRMASRVLRVFDDEDVAEIANAYHAWSMDGEWSRHDLITDSFQGFHDSGNYRDIPGFCRAVKLEDIRQNGYLLTPGPYVGSEEADEDEKSVAEKMKSLTAQLSEQFSESARLEEEIRRNLKRLGYGF